MLRSKAGFDVSEMKGAAQETDMQLHSAAKYVLYTICTRVCVCVCVYVKTT